MHASKQRHTCIVGQNNAIIRARVAVGVISMDTARIECGSVFGKKFGLLGRMP